MNLFLQTFKYFGAFVAIVLGIGLLSKSDVSLLGNHEHSTVEQMGIASLSPRPATSAPESDRLAEYRLPERSISTAPERPRTSNSSTRSTSPARPNVNAGNRSIASSRELENWIQTNASQTFLEAQRETISPGVILATGVYFLQEGQGDMNMSAADVAAYLAAIKDSAPAEAKSRMKYIANSAEWFRGLSMAGFDGERIAAIFDRYDLSIYDKQMYSRHVSGKMEESSYEVSDEALAADRTTRNHSLANAYNDYVEEPALQEEHGLASIVASERMSRSEVSDGRREAESFDPGESKVYDNPRFFFAVLQEIIALEHGYDSWDEYYDINSRAADREFQSRSDIMSLGGKLRITRQRS